MVLDRLKQLKKMRDQALKMQKELAQEVVEVEEGRVKVTISGDQKIKSLQIEGQEQPRLAAAINKAIKKSQEVAAKKLAQVGNLGGLLR